jgi:hypothetical protein
MKDIKDMNLRELADFVEDQLIYIHYKNRDDEMFVAKRLRQLHDLNRWIPVGERMPTEEDKLVLAWYATKYPFAQIVNWYEFPINNKYVTHWKRITPPEGV